MEVESAARRWKETWERAWPDGDVQAISTLYSDNALYRALVFREPERGLAGVRRYLEENFAKEQG
jgi:ketosteroid isomerase-like protein